jgi:hypothetical protein
MHDSGSDERYRKTETYAVDSAPRKKYKDIEGQKIHCYAYESRRRDQEKHLPQFYVIFYDRADDTAQDDKWVNDGNREIEQRVILKNAQLASEKAQKWGR